MPVEACRSQEQQRQQEVQLELALELELELERELHGVGLRSAYCVATVAGSVFYSAAEVIQRSCVGAARSLADETVG